MGKLATIILVGAYLMNNLGSENVRFSLTLIALLHL